MKERVLKVDGMSCGHCESSVERAVGGVAGVASASASAASGEVRVGYTTEPDWSAVEAAIDDAGFDLGED